MSIFSENIKHLRKKLKVAQRVVAESISITRDSYAKYEGGANEPSIAILLSLSRFHHVSIDLLLSVDIRKILFPDLIKIGENRILLPITVDKDGNNSIELITQKAKAGYLSGYADPEFIENLQHLTLPFLGEGKYRAFPIDGDSMPPHQNGDFIIGRYVEIINEIKVGKTYILLTATEGIVYKRIDKHSKNHLLLSSDNMHYPSYNIHCSELLEIWEFQCNIGRNDQINFIIPETIQEMYLELRKEIRFLKK